MPLFHPRRIAVLLCVAIVCVYAEKHAASIASMSIPEIEGKLQVHPTPSPTLFYLL
jgi:zinc transporter 7